MTVSDNLHNAAKEHLRVFVERIERVSEEKDALTADIAEIFKEAKSNGYDVKALRKIVALRKKDAHVLAEEEAILDSYKIALGMLGQIADLPLGQAAISHNSKAIGASQTGEAAVSTQRKADMDRARQRGADAADDGLKREENPFHSDDLRWAEWDADFSSAARLVAA